MNMFNIILQIPHYGDSSGDRLLLKHTYSEILL